MSRPAHDTWGVGVHEQGATLMQRRKFLIGVGSLAAGSAAAMGTGAVSQSSSNRAVDVDIANDSNGFLQFNVSGSSLENTEYVSYEDGQLTIEMDKASNDGFASQAEGLNPDSTFDFDNLFQILNATEDDLKADIDKSNLDNPDAFTFYAHQTNGDLIGSRSSGWSGQINSGFGVNIGMRVETPDEVVSDWETGSITITTADDSDKNV